MFFARFLYENQIPKFLSLDDHFIQFFRNDVKVKNLKTGTVVCNIQFQFSITKIGAVGSNSLDKRRFWENQFIKNFQFLYWKIFEKFKICLAISVNYIRRKLFAEGIFIIKIFILHTHYVSIKILETEENTDLVQRFQKP